MTVTDIITEFGAYYKNNGQNMQNLFRVAYNQTDSTKYMTSRLVDGTRYEVGASTIGQVLQPFHKNFTPTSGPTFTGKSITLYHHKADLSEYPDDLEATWLGFLADNNVKRTEWPYIKWLLETHVLPKFLRDYELNEVYKGVYSAPGGVTAGAAGTAMDGLGKVIADAITATEISPITTGAISSDPETFVAQVEDFVAALVGLNPDYAAIPMNIYMSVTNAHKFSRGYRIKYGKDTDFAGVAMKVLDTNFTIAGLSSMAGRSRIFTTTKENMLDLRFRQQREGAFDIQAAERQVKILHDTYRGVGFVENSIVFCNEQV